MFRHTIIGAAGLAAGLLAGPVSAETGQVGVELNKLKAVEGGCRAYMVFDNTRAHAFDAYTLDLVIFDKQGIIAKRLAVRTQGLRADKTTVKLFDIQGVACEDIGRFLLNRVRNCQPAGDATADCTAVTATSSRTDVPFVK